MERVLVIDDDPKMRELIADYLEHLGYEVLMADRGEPGLAMAATGSPDVVLLDVLMPDMDGYAVCQGLRGNPATQRIPVVMITSSDDPALIRKVHAAGAQACIPKPFRREALVATLRSVLGGGRPEEGSGQSRVLPKPPGS